MSDLSLDIQTFVRVAAGLALFFAVFSLWRGRVTIAGSDQLPYHRLRQQRTVRGWQQIFLGIILALVSAWLGFYGEQTAYAIFPVTATPSPTLVPTQTPTISQTPTITLTPSDTPTLEFTYTPSATPIPQMPDSVRSQFTALLTPSGNELFSPLVFSLGLSAAYEPLNSGTLFQNPISGIYANFSYDQMTNGLQWSALWYRAGQLIYYETLEWDGGTGGLGYSEWFPNAEEWMPGVYQVQIFVGEIPFVVGEFELQGDPATSTPTAPPTATITVTPTRTPTPTITPTHTRFPTATP